MALKNLRSGEQQEVPLTPSYELLKMLLVGEGMARNPALLEGAKATAD
jgi:histidyl-tRNA synthetase